MPDVPLPWLSWIVVALALGSSIQLALRPRRSEAELLFAVFCGSLAMEQLRPWAGTDTGVLWWVLAFGACATCNAYWLVARALFRGEGAVRLPHVAVACAIAVLILARRIAAHAASTPPEGVVAILGSLLTLASTGMLVLAFAEPLRGGLAGLPAQERRLRVGFVATFGGCVLLGTVCSALGEAQPDVAAWRPTVTSLCALSIVLYTHWALRVRRRHAAIREATRLPHAAGSATPRPEERRLAQALRQLVEVGRVHREPELKVADLARRLGTAEHKISRVITQVLGERNINQWLNRHRIDDACRLLRDPACTLSVLEISAESGFASLGPFNRAFKAATGATPSAYRQQAMREQSCATTYAADAAEHSLNHR